MVFQRIARWSVTAALDAGCASWPGACFVLVLALATTARAEDSRPVSVDEQAYQVRIELTFGSHFTFTPEARAAILSDLRAGLDRTVGDMWRVELVQDHSLEAGGLDALARLGDDDYRAQYEPAGIDKAFRVLLLAEGAGFRAAAREWDAETRQRGPIGQRTSYDQRELGNLLVELLRELFRPIALIEQVGKGPPTLRARAGTLSPHDESWQPLREGMLYESYYRYTNKDRVIERIQQIPWTYLEPRDVAGATSGCVVTSGLRIPLTGRRRRVEPVALGIAHQLPVTRLLLVTRPPARRPLGGIEVEVSEKSQTAVIEGKIQRPELLQRHVSDRNGLVSIGGETRAEAAMRPIWLFVRSGQNLLARVPFVPGVREVEILELPDDTLRLEIEGRVAQLQSELVDAVARRALLASMARNRAKARDWERSDEHLKAISTLPGAREFFDDLNTIRQPGLKAARARKDRTTELRIQKLCDDLAVLIKAYLEEDKLQEVLEEIAELRTVAAEDAAAEKEFKALPPQIRAVPRNSPDPPVQITPGF